MSRPGRIPGTRTLATGGKPRDTLIDALSLLPNRPGVYVANVAHDDGCPCLDGKPMPACTCELVDVTVERVYAEPNVEGSKP